MRRQSMLLYPLSGTSHAVSSLLLRTRSNGSARNPVSSYNSGVWTPDASERCIDWGWCALYGSVSLGRELTAALYNGTIAYSYYTGCSMGGCQGLKSTQTFPDDFGGIVATYNLPNDAPYHINEGLFPVISDEVFRQCDAVGGFEHSVVTNPCACNFLSDAVLCNSAAANTSNVYLPDRPAD
ncbi:hypothetical protein DAEQUDRAFT_762794 [Daedalea quercina L-15889]|uniref:Carboxylic ester hydrolase n=1 Tax=Daedalea quercina L-15889 TaxID=1314783 RepID=A0A165SUA6_9APHY|nr:hypothetical protein DAEQUDRAFT_762794 [Daedalea quercina L-15889]